MGSRPRKKTSADEDGIIRGLAHRYPSINYMSDVWDFGEFIAQKNLNRAQKRIIFSSVMKALPQEKLQSANDLLTSMKQFIAVRLIFQSPASGEEISPNTAVNSQWKYLRTLFKWMVDNDLYSFSEMSPKRCMAYAQYCRAASFKGRPIGIRAAANRIGILDSIYGMRGHLTDAIREHPWQGRAAFLVSKYGQSGQRSARTKVIPDIVVRMLVMRSVGIIERVDKERCVSNCGISALYQAQTASYLLIALFTGMRDSEISSLRTGCLKSERGWDGFTYHWLYGETYKYLKDERVERWMAPPLIKKVIRVLERIAVFMSGSEVAGPHIFVSRRGNDNQIKVITNGAIRERLSVFVKSVLSDTNARRKIGLPGDEEIEWRISPHQFRRTFAVYTAANILGDVRYLREHFKHWSLDMTLHYATVDTEGAYGRLAQDVLVERLKLQSRIIGTWINDPNHLSGRGGERVREYINSNQILAAKDPSALAEFLSDGFAIRGTGHSWCTAKECKGLGVYSILECRDCENRIIDASHLPVWEAIEGQQKEILNSPTLSESIKFRAQSHLEHAQEVIRSISKGGDEER